MKTTKSPRKVLQVSYDCGRRALAPYAHRFSPKKFTQPQLFACLALKEFLKLDYRGLMHLLLDSPDLCAVIEMDHVPHWTTLQKAADRLLKKNAANRLLDESLAAARAARLLRGRVQLAALDGSGFEAHHVSHYFVRRRARGDKHLQNLTYRRFPKAGLLVDCHTHLVLAVVPGRGPGPDHQHFRQALAEAWKRRPIDTLLADAGYDAEWVHRLARDGYGICALIPPTIGRPTAKPPSTPFRRRMRTYFRRPPERRRYGQRWQVETVISMIKRRLGETLSANSYHRQNRALRLKVITHNLMIVLYIQLFYRAGHHSFFARRAGRR